MVHWCVFLKLYIPLNVSRSLRQFRWFVFYLVETLIFYVFQQWGRSSPSCHYSSTPDPRPRYVIFDLVTTGHTVSPLVSISWKGFPLLGTSPTSVMGTIEDLTSLPLYREEEKRERGEKVDTEGDRIELVYVNRSFGPSFLRTFGVKFFSWKILCLGPYFHFSFLNFRSFV